MIKHNVEHNGKGGKRFTVAEPICAGQMFLDTSGELVRFDESGMAGMLACTRLSDGSQQLYFPQQLTRVVDEKIAAISNAKGVKT